MTLKILLNEIRYHWWIYSIGFSIALVFMLLFLFTGREILKFMLTTTGIFHLILIATAIRYTQEKRDRLLLTLPVPPVVIAKTLCLFVMFFQISIFMLWLVFFFIRYNISEANILWQLLTFNALILSVVMLFSINADLGFYPTHRYRVYFWIILILILLCTGFVIYYTGVLTENPDRFITLISERIAGTAAGGIGFNFLLAILIRLNIRIFLKRHSYTS